jgi:asparagine synthetase B (glutamine-hydrolysing)
MISNGKRIDKNFCMSSYLVYRYIENENVCFFEGVEHKNIRLLSEEEKIKVATSDEIKTEIEKTFSNINNEKLGILLSGGMDSAILASFMSGRDAYTFRYEDNFAKEDLKRAEKYAKYYGLTLHYVDLSWRDFIEYTPILMQKKGAPVHSIEPQIYKAALQAKSDGVSTMIIGNSADPIFGGMDSLLSQEWQFNDFVKRYTFLDPQLVLKEPVDVNFLFERYRNGEGINILSFIDNIYSVESSGSYWNAFCAADLLFCDPYAHLKMGLPLDLKKIRNGESKYLIRELFAKRYPDIPIPEKIPMPRQVDKYFANWNGPIRDEFLPDINVSKLSGNQNWQLHCLESFLNINS